MILLKQTVINLAWVFLRGQIRNFLEKNKEEVVAYAADALKSQLKAMDWPMVEGQTEEDLKRDAARLAETTLRAAIGWLSHSPLLG